MENTIDIQWAKPQHHNLIRDFYQDRGYQGGFTAEDQILLALDQEAIAGVVRLCEEEGVFILRGMQVHPRFQRQGLGFRMLRVFEHAIGPKECFVLPFDHRGDIRRLSLRGFCQLRGCFRFRGARN
ncbi:MAG: GNAT family N-acetyltransferase, partial [Pseudomonadota bacterium]